MAGSIALLYLLILVDSMSLSVLLPIIEPALLDTTTPMYMEDATNSQRSLAFGLLMGLPSLIVMYMGPVLASISDRIGRRPVLLVATAGLVCANLFTGLSLALGSMALLFAARLLAGATAAGQATSQAAILDRVAESRHGHHLALALFASSLGFVCGPLLAAVFLNLRSEALFEEEMPFYYLAGAALVAGWLLWLLLSEPRGDRQEFHWSLVRPRQGLQFFLPAARDERVRGLLLLSFTVQGAWAAYYIFGPNLLRTQFGFTKGMVGLYMSWIGIGLCLANGFLQPFLIRRFALRSIAAAGAATTCVAILCGMVMGDPRVQYGLAMIAGAAASVAYASIVTLMSLRVPRDRQGWILGIAGGVVSLAWGVASLASGLVGSMQDPGSGLTNALAAGLMLVSAASVARVAILPNDGASQRSRTLESGAPT